MYADRVENGGRRSVKERLNGNGVSGPTRQQHQRQITGKRFAILTSSCFCDGFQCFWPRFKFGCGFAVFLDIEEKCGGRFDHNSGGGTFVTGVHVEVV